MTTSAPTSKPSHCFDLAATAPAGGNNQALRYRRTIFKPFGLTYKHVDNRKFVLGFAVYFIIFIVLIPYLLYTNGQYTILYAYAPNVDMLATILGYDGGPLGLELFKYLYNPVTVTYQGFLSSMVINYVALLGLTYLVAYHTYYLRSITKGWYYAFFMIMITYLLPGNIIAYVMARFDDFLCAREHWGLHRTPSRDLLVYGLGFGVATSFILLEATFIRYLLR
jgi:hypothetical protein